MSELVVPKSDGQGFAALSNPHILVTQKRIYNIFLVEKSN
jgi:hypothetical protein